MSDDSDKGKNFEFLKALEVVLHPELYWWCV